MSLHIVHYQFSVGDPPEQPPSQYGYLALSGRETASAAPFGSAGQRTRYEEAVARFLVLDGLPVDALSVAALIVISMEGPLQEEFAREHLERLGLTGRPRAELYTLATTLIAGLPQKED